MSNGLREELKHATTFQKVFLSTDDLSFSRIASISHSLLAKDTSKSNAPFGFNTFNAFLWSAIIVTAKLKANDI